jgi:mannose-6-phosphate isomerase-like protein (cupin superfamily)
MVIRSGELVSKRLDVAPIDVKRIIGSEQSSLIAVTLMSLDGDHPPVTLHGTDTVYCFISGSGSITIGDAPPEAVGPGDFAFVPAGTQYSYSGSCEYIVAQGPPLAPGTVEFANPPN